MFSSVGWGEFFVLLVVGLLVIGPERLPGLIKEVRAVLLAIRNAVGQAREQLDSEFGDELKQFSRPIAELNTVRQMGAKGFITKTLLDGDDSLLTSLESTTNDVRNTVTSARGQNLRDAVLPSGSSHNPTVPVEQQALAGESRSADNTPGEPHQQHTPAQGSHDNAAQAAPHTGTSGSWDDVL